MHQEWSSWTAKLLHLDCREAHLFAQYKRCSVATALLRSACRGHAEAYGWASIGASVTLDDGQVLRARAVIGADGVRSVVGRALSIPAPNYAGYIAYRCAACTAHVSLLTYTAAQVGQAQRALLCCVF